MALKTSEVFLQELLKDLPPPKLISEKDKLREVTELTAGNSPPPENSNIVAVVVNSDNPSQCVGVIGKFELLDHLVTFIHKEGMGRTEEELAQMTKERLSDPAAHSLSVKDQLALGRLEAGDTLDKAIEMMTKGATRVVVSEGGQLLQVLTDDIVLKFLWARALANEWPELSRSIEQLGIYKGPSKVLIMYEDKPAITGYALMAIHGVKSLPIVGLDGKMYTTLGEADLKGISIPAIKKLALPVLDYLKHGNSLKQPYCKKSATLKDLVKIMEDCRVSKVWVVDDQKRVVGVATMSGVIGFLGSAR